MDLLIGEKLDRSLDPLESLARAEDLADLVERMMPTIEVIASERYVFDVILRRWQEFIGREAVLAETGLSFASEAQQRQGNT